MKDCYDIYEHWYCKNDIGPADGFAELYTLLEELVPDRHREEVFESFLALASRLEFEGFLNGIRAGREHVTASGEIVILPEE